MIIGKTSPKNKYARWFIFKPSGSKRMIIGTPWFSIWFAPNWWMITFPRLSLNQVGTRVYKFTYFMKKLSV